MTTRAQLVTMCRNHIGDITPGNYVFTEDQIIQWINEAIRDLSQHFPKAKSDTLTTTAGTHKYLMELDTIGIISVEYPTGEDPPRYLTRRPYTHPDFWLQEGYYDFVKVGSAAALDPPQLWITDETEDTEYIEVWYNGERTQLTASNTTTDIPDRYLHLIPLFVRWKAWSDLATMEGMDPDPIKLLAATQEVNAYRAERAYRTSLQEAKSTESETSITPPWKMDKWDRSY